MRDSHRALREGTREEHERLDELFGRFDLTDRAEYGAFLAAHAAALLPLESALDAAGAARLFEDWADRRRGALLVGDLAALGLAVPDAVPVPPLADDAAIAGAVYVVEGSRLGGRLLARGVAAGLPTGYLDPDQDGGGWGRLLARIDSLLYDEVGLSHAIATARATFASFEDAGRRWLSRVG